MQGYTDHVFRMALHRCFGGVDTMFTPFMRLEGGKLRRRDERELQLLAAEPATVPQILPKNFDEALAMAQTIAAAGLKRIDINMSCPFVPVMKSGRGASLLADAGAVADVLKVAERMPDIEFSLKIRLGVKSFDDLADEVVEVVNNARLKYVTVHGRTAAHQYAGEASQEAFARFYGRCRHKMVYNGDVDSLQRAEELRRLFPELHAVMIGRAIVARPYLLVPDADEQERLERLRRLYDAGAGACEQSSCGDVQWLDRMQSFWKLFLPDADRKLRKKILKTRKPDAFRAYTAEILSSPSAANVTL